MKNKPKKNARLGNTIRSLETFAVNFDGIKQDIIGHAGKLAANGFYNELYLWYGVLIEAVLAIYLVLFDELIADYGLLENNFLKDYQPLRLDDIINDKYTLGRLISEFKKVSKNNELITKLDDFKNTRNDIVHNFISKGLILGRSNSEIPVSDLKSILDLLDIELNSLSMVYIKKVSQLKEDLIKKSMGDNAMEVPRKSKEDK